MESTPLRVLVCTKCPLLLVAGRNIPYFPESSFVKNIISVKPLRGGKYLNLLRNKGRADSQRPWHHASQKTSDVFNVLKKNDPKICRPRIIHSMKTSLKNVVTVHTLLDKQKKKLLPKTKAKKQKNLQEILQRGVGYKMKIWIFKNDEFQKWKKWSWILKVFFLFLITSNDNWMSEQQSYRNCRV